MSRLVSCECVREGHGDISESLLLSWTACWIYFCNFMVWKSPSIGTFPLCSTFLHMTILKWPLTVVGGGGGQLLLFIGLCQREDMSLRIVVLSPNGSQWHLFLHSAALLILWFLLFICLGVHPKLIYQVLYDIHFSAVCACVIW